MTISARSDTARATAVHSRAADARRFGRFWMKSPALLYCHGRFQRVNIVNVSQGGARLDGAFGIMPRDRVKLELLDRRLLTGTAVWVIANRVGIAFDKVLGEDDLLLEAAQSQAQIAKAAVEPSAWAAQPNTS